MTATLNVKTKHSPIAFLLYTTKINLTVDGKTEKVRWGEQVLTLEPGTHQVEISFQYFGRAMGKASTTVEAIEGSTSSLVYSAPLLVTSAGKVRFDET